MELLTQQLDVAPTTSYDLANCQASLNRQILFVGFTGWPLNNIINIKRKPSLTSLVLLTSVLKKYLIYFTIPFYYFMAITAFSFFVLFAIPQESVVDTVSPSSSPDPSTSPPSSTSRTVMRERHRESQSVYIDSRREYNIIYDRLARIYY